MRYRVVCVSRLAPDFRLRITEPGRVTPALEFEGPEVGLMLNSGCLNAGLEGCGVYRCDPHQVSRIIQGVLWARVMLRNVGALDPQYRVDCELPAT